jgi:hypothetical protein
VKLEPSQPGIDEQQSSAEGELSRMSEESRQEAQGALAGTSVGTAARDSLNKILSEDAWEDSEGADGQAPTIQAMASDSDGEPETARPIPTPHVSKNGEVRGEELAEFELQSPADLLKVARASGLSYQTVKSLNPEILRWCTPPAVRSYRIKLPVSVKDRFLATYNHAAFPRRVQFLAYRVRRGETLSHVARRFGIKADPMADLNRISPRAPLREGARVLLPMPDDRSRSLASLEVKDAPEKRRYRRYRKAGSKYYRVSLQKRAAARNASKRASRSIQ